MFTGMRWGLTALLAAALATPAAAVTGMKYVSTAGDYIGQGLTQTFLPPTASFTASATGNVALVSVTDANNWWYLSFAGPSGSPLSAGAYANASRYPFQSPLGAGLDMSGDGRGCNTLKGWFRVREIAFDRSGQLSTLAVDYLQKCEVTGPPLYGAVRINSKFPLAIPMTVAVAGADFAVMEGSTARLDGTQSFTRRANHRLTYAWTQTAGPAVVLSNPAGATPSFKAPAVDLNGATLVFQLEVQDVTGARSVDNVAVIVESAAAPRTAVDFHGDAGDYITGGRSYHFDTHNAQISYTRNFDGGVSASVSGDSWWYFDTAAASGKVYKAGVYKNAERFPFQGPTAPGLSLWGDGRGCNTVTGQFTVFQIEFDKLGQPSMADIGFTQHCEGGAPAASGELLLNAVPHQLLADQFRAARQRYPRP